MEKSNRYQIMNKINSLRVKIGKTRKEGLTTSHLKEKLRNLEREKEKMYSQRVEEEVICKRKTAQ